ncbi:MAG: CAP domain-containing protein [Bacteroides sp.]|nr:CAP domain-containing protein [Bacteroides sp.]
MLRPNLKFIFTVLLSAAALSLTACHETSPAFEPKKDVPLTVEESTETLSFAETELFSETAASTAASPDADAEQTSAELTREPVPETSSEAETALEEPPAPAPDTGHTEVEAANRDKYISGETAAVTADTTIGTARPAETTDTTETAAPIEPITAVETEEAAETAPKETEGVSSDTAAPPPDTVGENYGQRGYTQAELDFIERVFELTNREREKEGLPAFRHMDALDAVAAVRAWELTVEYRSDHTRPDGSSYIGAFNENGIVYGAWGENIAAGQDTPEAVVEAWMNSPHHRAAILNAEYDHMGVGFYYVENDSQEYYYFWTQEFYCY